MHSYTRTFLGVAKFYNIKGICLVLILETLNCYTVKTWFCLLKIMVMLCIFTLKKETLF